jgi:hypothetical protein
MKPARRHHLGALIFTSVIMLGSLGISSSFGKPGPAQAETGRPAPEKGLLTRFPFVFDGRILVPLRINDSPPLEIILDSGFSSRALLLMHKETGDELGLTYVRTVDAVRGAGSGENKAAHVTAGERLSLPGLDLGKVATAIMDESREISLHHNKGVIGGAVFIPYVVKIDFEDFNVSIYDPELFAPEDAWEELPLAFGRNLPILETTLCISEGGEIPVRLLIDTGGKPALAMVVDTERRLAPPARTVHFLSGTGFRGNVFADHGRLSTLKIGGHVLKNVISAFWTGEEAPALAEVNADGPLGLGSLYRFNMIFDYAHRRMFVKPNRFYSDPFEMNMAGIAFEETVSGDLAVYHVMDGSEAAEKGLQKGDVIVELDGREAGGYTFLELKRLFERDGKTVKVKVRRGGEIREVKLELKWII